MIVHSKLFSPLEYVVSRKYTSQGNQIIITNNSSDVLHLRNIARLGLTMSILTQHICKTHILRINKSLGSNNITEC